MPKRSRIDAACALHHVMVTGIERGTVFRSDTQSNQFLDRSGEILEKTTLLPGSEGTWVAYVLPGAKIEDVDSLSQ